MSKFCPTQSMLGTMTLGHAAVGLDDINASCRGGVVNGKTIIQFNNDEMPDLSVPVGTHLTIHSPLTSLLTGCVRVPSHTHTRR
jgi:hypothetical protein